MKQYMLMLLKPRTVSLEDGEDDVTPPISSNIQKYTPSYFWSGSDKKNLFSFKFSSGSANKTHACMAVGFLMIDQSKKGARSITLWRDKMVAYQFEKQVNQDSQSR
jgi:hypothetical protein